MLLNNSLSLQKKFILFASLAILVLTGALGFLVATKTKEILYNATEKQGRVLAQTVAALIINELIYEKLGLVEEGGLIDNYVQELYQRRDLDFLYIAVLDETGRVLSHNDFREYGKVYSNKLIDGAQVVDKVLIGKKSHHKAMYDSLEFAAPLSIGGKRWGYLLFEVSLERVEHDARTMLLQIIEIAFGALLFCFFLIFFLSLRFIRPITDLAAAMREVDVELPDRRIEVKGNDELAELGKSFNAMVERIRQTNADMKLTHEKLLQSEKMATLGLLASSIAHRINNPLGGIMNCVSILERQGGGDPKFLKNYIDLMKEGLESIEQTVGELLWTAGKRRSDVQTAGLKDVLAGVTKFLDFRIKKAGIIFQTDFDPGLIIPVAPHDLNQILLNLLVNSVQAMPDGGRLLVAAAKKGDYIVLTVTDTGTGIAVENQDKVFDLFFSTKPTGEGTGLGLWMTYELVKNYHGDIRIDSQEKKGTTVTIVFGGQQ